MEIKLVMRPRGRGTISHMERLYILADAATPEDLEHFSGLLSRVFEATPTPCFPLETGKPIKGYEVDGGFISRPGEKSPLLRVTYSGGTSGAVDPILYFATSKGLTSLKSNAFSDLDWAKACEQGRIYNKPNYLAVTLLPHDGLRVLEALVRDGATKVPYGTIHPHSTRVQDIYAASGLGLPIQALGR